MSTEAFEAKSGAKLAELAPRSRASVVGKIRGLGLKNQSVNQEGANKVSAARKLSIILTHVLDLSDYVLDLSDYTGISNVSSNTFIVSCLL